MPDVFVSYSRRNKEFVQKLVKSLNEDKRDVWVDWEDIPVTADWLEEIYQGIRESDSFIFVITPDSVQSEVCGWELKYALENKKRLIPILHEEIVEDNDKKAMHPAVSSHNWIFFRESDDYNAMFKLLKEALDTDLDHVREHTRILVRAKQWDSRGRTNSFLISGDELIEAEQWLSKAADKDPEPTELQMQYVYESRKATNRRQQTVVAASLFAAAVSIVLAILAGIFYLNAEENRQEAESQREIAERNASEARSLALAANAQLAFSVGDNDQAIALGLEANDPDAMEMQGDQEPPVEAQRILEDAAYAPGTRRIFQRHSGSVNAVEFLPDGERAISAGADGMLVLWDIQTGESLRTYDETEAPVNTMEVSADGTRFVTGNEIGVVIVWDVESGDPIVQFPDGHIEPAVAVAINADGTQVASGSEDDTVIVWDVEDEEAVQLFNDSTDDIRDIAFSNDGTLLAVGSEDEFLRVYEIDSGDEVLSVEVGFAVTSVTFNPQDSAVLTGSGGFTLNVWDLESGERLNNLTGHQDFVNDATYSSEGLYIISAANDTTVRLWNVQTGEESVLFRGHEGRVNDVDFSPDGRLALSASEDGDIRLWDLAHGSEITRLDGHNFDVIAADFSADGSRALTGSWDRSVIVWDLEQNNIFRQLPGHTIVVTTAMFDSDASHVLSADGDGAIYWDLDTEEQVWRFEHQQVRGIDLTADDLIAATGGLDGNINLWSTETGEQVGALTGGHTRAVTSVEFSADDSQLLSASSDTNVILWDVEAEAVIRTFDLGDVIQSVTFAAGGESFFAAVGNNILQIDLESGDLVNQFEGHADVVRAIALSADGSLLVSGASDNTLRSWDIASGEELRSINVPGSVVRSVAISSDGLTAMTGADDQKARLWEITPPTLDEIRTWADENRAATLTCDERALYSLELPEECETDEVESVPVSEQSS